MACIYDQDPFCHHVQRLGQNYQIRQWDMSPANNQPRAPSQLQYVQVYRCPSCHFYLPYPGASHDDCEDTEDGFVEFARYRDAFVRHFEQIGTSAAGNIYIFFQCGDHYHIVDPPPPDSSDESDNDSIFSGFSDLLEMDGGEEEPMDAVDEEEEVMDAD